MARGEQGRRGCWGSHHSAQASCSVHDCVQVAAAPLQCGFVRLVQCALLLVREVLVAPSPRPPDDACTSPWSRPPQVFFSGRNPLLRWRLPLHLKILYNNGTWCAPAQEVGECVPWLGSRDEQ